MLYPAELAVFYPHPVKPGHLEGWFVAYCPADSFCGRSGRVAEASLPAGGLAVVSGDAGAGHRPLQVGDQARADRYTYLPQIGLYMMVAWGAAQLCSGWRYRRAVLGSAAGAILAGLLACAYVQTGYWKNSISLWTHTLACTSENYLAHNNFGQRAGRPGEVEGSHRTF